MGEITGDPGPLTMPEAEKIIKQQTATITRLEEERDEADAERDDMENQLADLRQFG